MAVTKLQTYRGDSKDIDLTFTTKTGSPVNITDFTIFFTVKDATNLSDTTDDGAVITKDVTVHTAPEAGQTRISLGTADTNITPNSYIYDIQVLNSGSSKVSTPVKGQFIVMQDVTKRET